MSKINTAANLSSAFSNSAAARAAADTSQSVGRLASSDRHRELRERGLITHRSTPADIQAVEDRLAAEMRGRMMLQGAKAWNRRPYLGVIGLVSIVLLLSFPILGGSRPWLALILLVPAVAIAAFLASQIREQEQERADLIARASWSKKGKCRWCGTTDPHIVEGEEEHPRVAHAYELEQKLGPLWVEVRT